VLLRKVNRFGPLAGVPFLDRPVVLQARIAADPGALGHLVQQPIRILAFEHLAGRDRAGAPLAPLEGGLHERVAHPDGEVLVLVHDRAVGVAVERPVVALLDERPGLLLFLLFGVDEFLDVAVPIPQRVHLRRAPGFAAGLHHVRHLVVDFKKTQRPARFAAAAEFLLARPDGGQIGAGAGTVLEEHGLAVGQLHDALHVVVDTLDEAGAGLGVFVLRGGPVRPLLGPVVVPVAASRSGAHAVLVVEPHVEPHGRIERATLVEAQPGQLVIEHLAVFLAKVTVPHPPVRNGPSHPVDELPHRVLALSRLLRVAIKVLRAHHLRGQDRPRAGHLDVLLPEDGLARIVGDLRRPPLPGDLVERLDLGIAEDAFEPQRLPPRARRRGARA